MGQQLLIERAPIGPDAHRFLCLIAVSTMAAKLPVLLLLEADIPRVDAVFVERLGAGGMIGEELVADIMKVPDDRDVDAELEEPFLDMRHGSGRLVAVDGDAHDFRTCARQIRHLPSGRLHIGGIRIGHGLNDDGRPPPTVTPPTSTAIGLAALLRPGFGHKVLLGARFMSRKYSAVSRTARPHRRVST